MSELDIVYCILSEQKLQDEQIDTESIPYPNFFTREAVKNTKRVGGSLNFAKKATKPWGEGRIHKFTSEWPKDITFILYHTDISKHHKQVV